MVKSVDTTASSVYLQPMQHRMLALHTLCNFSRGTRQQTPGFLEAEAQAQAKVGARCQTPAQTPRITSLAIGRSMTAGVLSRSASHFTTAGSAKADARRMAETAAAAVGIVGTEGHRC